MIKYLIGVLAIAILGIGGFAGYKMTQVNALQSENRTLLRNLRSLEAAAAQAEEAREVAKAHAERWEQRAAEYETALDELTEGVEDETLDPVLRGRLNRLLGDDRDGVRPNDGSGGAPETGANP